MPEPQVQTPEGRGMVELPSVSGLPDGYVYGVTRYADVILQQAFGARLRDLCVALDAFRPTLDELRAGGGGRTVFVRRFDDSLHTSTDGGQPIWGKRNIQIEKRIDNHLVYTVRGHEIDMFGAGSVARTFPGVAVEMEWNNKDPFFDRDLLNFQALHREGVIGVGVIVTRGPRLQHLIAGTIRSKDEGFKYGQSTTHWDKLIPRVNLGGGGECPLLLIGIEPERIDGIEVVRQVRHLLDLAEGLRSNWRAAFSRYRDAQAEIRRLKNEAMSLLPPLDEVEAESAN